MAQFSIVLSSSDKDNKIHYIELTRGIAGELTECGIDGPFELTKITYKDRYQDKVCKKCFKSYISSLSQE